MNRKLFGVLSLENEDLVTEAPTDTVEVNPEEIIETASGVEEAHDDVVAQLAELESMEVATAEGVESSDTLVDLGDQMADATKEGQDGFGEQAAQTAQIVIESMRTRLGIVGKAAKQYPSLESYKVPRARHAATVAALESGVIDTLKKIWQGIVTMIKTIGTKIASIFLSLVKNYGMLEKHLEKLKMLAQKIEGSSNGTIDKPTLAAFFNGDVKGTMEAADKLEDAVKKVSEFVASKNDLDKMADMDEAAAEAAVKEHFEALVGTLGGLGFEKKSDGEGSAIGPFPGGLWIKVSATNGISFETAKSEGKALPVLGKAEIISLLDSAIAQAKKGTGIKEVAAVAEKAVKSVGSVSERILGRLNSIKEGGKGKGIKAAGAAAKGYANAIQGIVSKLPAAHYYTVKYAGDYAAACISSYKKEPKEGAPAAEKKEGE